MKKFLAAMLVIIMVVVTLCVASAVGVSATDEASVQSEYFRIHVRANSNSQIDQEIKYQVKDKVVEYITPYVAQCVTKDKAMEIIGGILPQIEEVCDSALAASGFTYKSKAQIKSENFPTRVYGGVTLEQGVYDALIIELGSGTGDNWWCVIYPPLCFTSTTASVQYRSAICDIIKKFFA